MNNDFIRDLLEKAKSLRDSMPTGKDNAGKWMEDVGALCENLSDREVIRPDFIGVKNQGSFRAAVRWLSQNVTSNFTPGGKTIRKVRDRFDAIICAIDAALVSKPCQENWIEYKTEENDQLLPIAGRKAFDKDIKVAVKYSGHEVPLSLLMIDIDHFKNVNDTFGHPAGDKVLVAAANVLLEAGRGKAKAYRYGGEELTLLLPNFLDGEARSVAERIRKAVKQLVFSETELKVTVSIGVAQVPSHGVSDKDGLIFAADSQMYRAKESGRDRVCLNEFVRPDEKGRKEGVDLPDDFTSSMIKHIRDVRQSISRKRTDTLPGVLWKEQNSVSKDIWSHLSTLEDVVNHLESVFLHSNTTESLCVASQLFDTFLLSLVRRVIPQLITASSADNLDKKVKREAKKAREQLVFLLQKVYAYTNSINYMQKEASVFFAHYEIPDMIF